MGMDDLDLSTLPWTLVGWRPFAWRWKLQEASSPGGPDVRPVPATVPGSVQQALLNAGIIPDWHDGLNSRAVEWVEHRHWEFSCVIPAGRFSAGQRLILDAQGLDYSGWIMVDGKDVAVFAGALLTHAVDLTAALGDGQAHKLSIIFDQPPAEDGQTGYASQSKYFKPRYSYSWDWCPRIVPMGIWDALWIRAGIASACRLTSVGSELAADLRTGAVHTVARLDPAFGKTTGAMLHVTVCDGDRVLASRQQAIISGHNVIDLPGLPVEPWQPNGQRPESQNESKTYQFHASVVIDGREVWEQQRTIGFRRIEWRACQNAPAGAEPWICVINGKPTFLQGVNWTPVTSIYHDTTVAQYAKLIQLYREMGCNLLRVWGGAPLEREVFYDLCDRAGLLVWQEMPLAASGVDNWAPEDPAAILQLTRITRSYIERRAHHPALLLWCGGNELQGGLDGGKKGSGKPVDINHPAMRAMADVVRADDPGRRFIPTSASGPRFMAFPADFGKGLHHDVHGPWNLDDGGLAAWQTYWDGDDALFRSEVGAPGACSVELIKRHAGALPLWPPTTDYWNHTASWWTQWNRFAAKLGILNPEQALAAYVEMFQKEQADALSYAAARCKARFPRCGGFIVWMGHDCYPVPVNTAIIDFARNPKPAYYALRKVYLEKLKSV